MNQSPTPMNTKPKRIYHLPDWKKYNQGLINRYSLDIWIIPKVINNWYYKRQIRIRIRRD